MQKTQKGITLVALVITIIILLILAGISIASLTQTGLFEKAKDAKQKSENAQAEENATLENYIAQIDEITGGKKTDSEQSTYTAYNVGDEVRIGTESFYVIEASDANTETVKLLAKYNLNKAGTKQAPNANFGDTACAFSSSNYWSSETTYPLNLNNYTIPDGKTSSITTANTYATTCGATKGRLLTKEKADALKSKIDNGEDSDGKIAKMLLGQENTQSDGNYLCYWLGSAYDHNFVWVVSGDEGPFYIFDFEKDLGFGVRPVIEISKSKI